MDASFYHACIPDASYGLSGSGVIVAVLDSGIDYTHVDFRNADGTTRIMYLWDMTIEGTPPKGFEIGHLYTAESINAALANSAPLSIIPQTDYYGHGTAVAGIAAGKSGIAPDAELLVIRLGRQENELIQGIKFAAEIAEQKNMPCAINISIGINDCAHDGSSPLEKYADQAAENPNISIVAAAGNEGSAGHHFYGVIPTGATETVEFNVSGGNYTMYMVLLKDFSDNFTIELINPTGKTTGTVNQNSFTLDGVNITISMGIPTHDNVNQEMHIIFNGHGNQITRGLWRLKITSVYSMSGAYNVWLPTVEEVTKDTAFTNPNPSATITMPATAASVIAVGAYNALIDAAAEFSGRGMQNGVTKPDIVAPGVGIMSTRLGGGSDSYTGTSLAAPFVTGAAALLMEWGIVEGNDKELYGEKLKAFLRKGATRSPYRTYPNNIWGYGALCIRASLDAAMEVNQS